MENAELFNLDNYWITSPFIVTEVTRCNNCDTVGGISISIQPRDKSLVLVKVLCKLCGLDFEEFAENAEHAKLVLNNVVDLFEEEE